MVLHVLYHEDACQVNVVRLHRRAGGGQWLHRTAPTTKTSLSSTRRQREYNATQNWISECRTRVLKVCVQSVASYTKIRRKWPNTHWATFQSILMITFLQNDSCNMLKYFNDHVPTLMMVDVYSQKLFSPSQDGNLCTIPSYSRKEPPRKWESGYVPNSNSWFPFLKYLLKRRLCFLSLNEFVIWCTKDMPPYICPTLDTHNNFSNNTVLH